MSCGNANTSRQTHSGRSLGICPAAHGCCRHSPTWHCRQICHKRVQLLLQSAVGRSSAGSRQPLTWNVGWWIGHEVHLCIPCAERLDGAAEHDDLPCDSWLHRDIIKAAGSCPAVLHIVEAQIEADCLRQKRQQRPLLQLVVQNRRVALAPAPPPFSL